MGDSDQDDKSFNERSLKAFNQVLVEFEALVQTTIQKLRVQELMYGLN